MKICLYGFEKLILVAISGAIIIHFASSFPFIVPSLNGGPALNALIATKSYSLVFLVLSLVFIIASALGHAKHNTLQNLAWLKHDSLLLARLMASLIAAVILMQMFKFWSHLKGVYYDETYQAIDQSSAAFMQVIHGMDAFLNIPHIWYFSVFAKSFLVVFFILALCRKDLFIQAFSTIIHIMILGGIAYMIAPALGPFVYYQGSGELAYIQRVMLEDVHQYTIAHGNTLLMPQFRLDSALGAMPSLHLAHIAALNYYLFRLKKWAGFAFLPVTFYIGIYAMLTGFHYLIDLPFGLLITLLAIVYTKATHCHIRSEEKVVA